MHTELHEVIICAQSAPHPYLAARSVPHVGHEMLKDFRLRHLRAEVKGDDEIAYLAESLNELLENIQAITPPDSESSEKSE